MARVALIFLVAFLAVNSVQLFPTQDYVVPNTPENIERLKNLGPKELAEQFSGQFEGDMVIPPEELEEILSGKSRTGLINLRYRWTDNIIPYIIRDGYYTVEQQNHIHLAVQTIMSVTCLKFVPYNPAIHTNYVFVTGEGSGCNSAVGMRGGGQRVNLQAYPVGSGCFRLYTIVHEFLHSLGFHHMQSATERDDYVEIVWENIEPGREGNFRTYDANTISQFGVGYDYGSVMHYSADSFSVNGEDTIIPLRPLNGEVMGQRERLSAKDIQRVNNKYCR